MAHGAECGFVDMNYDGDMVVVVDLAITGVFLCIRKFAANCRRLGVVIGGCLSRAAGCLFEMEWTGFGLLISADRVGLGMTSSSDRRLPHKDSWLVPAESNRGRAAS